MLARRELGRRWFALVQARASVDDVDDPEDADDAAAVLDRGRVDLARTCWPVRNISTASRSVVRAVPSIFFANSTRAFACASGATVTVKWLPRKSPRSSIARAFIQRTMRLRSSMYIGAPTLASTSLTSALSQGGRTTVTRRLASLLISPFALRSVRDG